MSMLDDAADETKDAIKEAQRRRQEAGGDDAAEEPGAGLPMSDIAGEVQETLTGAQDEASRGGHLGTEANAELMDPDVAGGQEQTQPRRDEGDVEEGLDRPHEPEDPTQEDPASPELDPSRVQGDPGEDAR